MSKGYEALKYNPLYRQKVAEETMLEVFSRRGWIAEEPSAKTREVIAEAARLLAERL